MTGVIDSYPKWRHGLISVESGPKTGSAPILSRIKGFKKPFTAMGVFLGWGEKLAPADMARFFKAKRTELGVYSATFDVPGVMENAQKFSQNMAELSAAKTPEQQNKAIKTGVISTLDIAASGADLLKSLDETGVLKLDKFSPMLTKQLAQMSIVARFFLKGNELIHTYSKWHAYQPRSQLELPSSLRPISRNEKAWLNLELVRSAVGFYAVVLSGLSGFMAIAVSSYWMLCISTFLFAATLTADICTVFNA